MKTVKLASLEAEPSHVEMINELWVLLADMSNLTSPASKLSISVDTLMEFMGLLAASLQLHGTPRHL